MSTRTTSQRKLSKAVYNSTNATYTKATGGTVIDSGGYRYHVFTNSGTFSVIAPTLSAQVVLVGGGGAGGAGHGGNGDGGGGGGAGKLVTQSISPSAGDYSIVVGTAGTGADIYTATGGDGLASTGFTYTAAGGKGGNTGHWYPTGWTAPQGQGGNGGGSGGGGCATYAGASAAGGSSGGAGNTVSGARASGKGGGWTDSASLIGTFITAGSGGSGIAQGLAGGGGGGGVLCSLSGVTQLNGSAGGLAGTLQPSIAGYAGTGFGAGGGGGSGSTGYGGNGAKGIVIVRYVL